MRDKEMKGAAIMLNKAQCGICKDILTSTHRHDFQVCSCMKKDRSKGMFVDGGLDYLRRGGYNIIEMSEYK